MIRYGKSPWGPLMHEEPTKEQLAGEVVTVVTVVTPVVTGNRLITTSESIALVKESMKRSADRHKSSRAAYMREYRAKRRAK